MSTLVRHYGNGKPQIYFGKPMRRRQALFNGARTTPCAVCGKIEVRKQRVDYHHPEGVEKKCNVMRSGGTLAAMEEAKKCVVLCRSCHTKVSRGKVSI